MQPDLNALVASLLESGDAKLIPFDDRYAVTKDGQLFSRSETRNRKNRRFSTTGWRKKGTFKAGSKKQYIYCHLHDSSKSISIHRLVALAFIGPKPKKQEVRHLDGNPQNNNLKNLCYGTKKENMADAIRHGTWTRGDKAHRATLTNIQVWGIKNMIASGLYTSEAITKKFKTKVPVVNSIMNGLTWAWLD